jgi:hypothetical protein
MSKVASATTSLGSPAPWRAAQGDREREGGGADFLVRVASTLCARGGGEVQAWVHCCLLAAAHTCSGVNKHHVSDGWFTREHLTQQLQTKPAATTSHHAGNDLLCQTRKPTAPCGNGGSPGGAQPAPPGTAELAHMAVRLLLQPLPRVLRGPGSSGAIQGPARTWTSPCNTSAESSSNHLWQQHPGQTATRQANMVSPGLPRCNAHVHGML